MATHDKDVENTCKETYNISMATHDKDVENERSNELCFDDQALSSLSGCLQSHSSKSCVKLSAAFNGITCLPRNIGQMLPNITYLSLMGNQVKCLPDSFGLLRSLKELYLQENNLQTLPESFSTLTNLKFLNLDGNKLAALPPGFGYIHSLTELSVNCNELMELPCSFTQLVNLSCLSLSGNRLTSLPQNFHRLVKLSVVNLEYNSLRELPESFALLGNVRVLCVSCNQIKRLMDTFRSASKLVEFRCKENELTHLPNWVSDMPNIEILKLKDNCLQHNPFLNQFGHSAGKLRSFNISGNMIESLPESIGSLKHLKKFHVGSMCNMLEEKEHLRLGNHLTRLPNGFCLLENLQTARLEENCLVSLPKDIGKLACLKTLNVGQNRLVQLPASFCNLRNLAELNVSYNRLTKLPSRFGDLVNLQELIANHNSLTELPESLYELKKLRYLDLFDNEIEEMPTRLSRMPYLLRLDIDKNPCMQKKEEDAASDAITKEVQIGDAQLDDAIDRVRFWKGCSHTTRDNKICEEPKYDVRNLRNGALRDAEVEFESANTQDEPEYTYSTILLDTVTESVNELCDSDWQYAIEDWPIDFPLNIESECNLSAYENDEKEDWDLDIAGPFDDADEGPYPLPIPDIKPKAKGGQLDCLLVPSDDHKPEIIWKKNHWPPVVNGQFDDAD